MIDSIEDVNTVFFGKDKAKEYVVDDLALCIERIIQQQIIDHILMHACDKYEEAHHFPSEIVEKDGEKYEVTSVGILDPENMRAVNLLQKSCFDALMLSMRSLFANSGADHTSGGAFLRRMRNFPDLENSTQERWREIAKDTGWEFVAIRSKDYKTRQATLSDNLMINIEKFESDQVTQSLIVNNRKVMIYNFKAVKEFKKKLLDLYDKLYRCGDYYANNYKLLREYQRDNFHREEWIDGKKFEIETIIEPDDAFVKKTIYHKKHKYNIHPYELHEILDAFAEIILRYSRLYIFSSTEGQFAPPIRWGVSLKAMVEHINELFANPLPYAEQQAVVDTIRDKMPHCLEFLHMQ